MNTLLQRVEPAYWHLNEAELIGTDGDQVAGLNADAGFVPDADQEQLLNGIFARRLDGGREKSLAATVALIACRQNIKTATEIMACNGWLFLFHVNLIVWTAHRWDTVDEAFEVFDAIWAGSPSLAKQILRVNRADRKKEVVTRRGGRMIFKTRAAGDGGRGLTGEKVIFDEAYALRNRHTSAFTPTMSARSITGDPQTIYGSSAAHEDSEVLHPLIKRGRAAAGNPLLARLERRLMYVEYCAPPPAQACDRGERCDHALDTPGCGCDKPEMLARANPALGRRISLDYVLDTERRDMDPHEFGRERLGWHDNPVGQNDVIPLTEWANGLDAGSEPAGPVALSVVYTRDKRRAVIGLAGRRADRTWHVEIADVVSPSQVVQRVGEIIARAEDSTRPVCAIGVDRSGFEAECIKGLIDLREVEVDGETVPVRIFPAKPDDLEWAYGRPPVLVRMAAPEVATAYSGFLTSVTESRDLHHRGQDELTLALMGATSRDVGDAGEAWGRRKSAVEGHAEIAPVVAVTNARWVHLEKAPLSEPEPQVWAL